MNQQMIEAKSQLAQRKEANARQLLAKQGDWDIYGDDAMLHLYFNQDIDRANEALLRAARWYELPHPTGRDHRGEVDFTAIRLMRTLYQSEDLLTEPVRKAVKRFFLTQDFSSMHGSENHSLLFYVSRYLAAQFYAGETFSQYGKATQELLNEDQAYLREFIRFRARRGWGEFDSCGYGAEVLLAMETLYDFCTDEKLKHMTHMMIDLMLMDMAADCLDGGLLGGAHGRIYEPAAMDNLGSPLFSYYVLYFGGRYASEKVAPPKSSACLTTYVPSDIVYEMAMGRTFPYENREAKNLHIMSAWMQGHDILWKELFITNGRISKYTYLTDDYAIGAVNQQDDYRLQDGDAWYAHHQQHEWDLTLAGDTGIKIFGHHPGHSSYFNQHGYWTGDLGCCCGTFYCQKNVVLSMYDIQKEEEHDFIHARVPLAAFEEVLEEDNLLLLRRDKVYVALHFPKGYEIMREGQYAGNEVISRGRQNALVCQVGTEAENGSFAAFCQAMRAQRPQFDAQTMTLAYANLRITKKGRYVNGELMDAHYDTYDSPYLQSKWDSGIVYVRASGKTMVYDFNDEVVWEA